MTLCLGVIYAWSIFVVPLENEFGWLREKTSLTFMISMICFCIGGLFSGISLIKGKSFRVMLFLASALLIIGFIAASTTTQLWQFYIFYGVLCGFGVGVAYNAIISTSTKFFEKSSGAASGAMLMGFGVGALVFGVAFTRIMELVGWRALFIGVGIVFGIIFIVGTLVLSYVMKFAPAASASKEEVAAGVVPAGYNKITYGLNLGQMLKRPEFWLLFLWILFFGPIGLALIGNVAPAALTMGATATLAAVFAGIVSLFNGIGRVVFGACFDRFGFRPVGLLVTIGTCIAVALIVLSTGASNLIFFFVACALTGFCFSAMPVSSAYFIMKQYGPPHFSVNFSATNTNLLGQAAIGSGAFAAYLAFKGNNYADGFMLLIPLAIIGVIIFVMLMISLKKLDSKG